MQREAIIDLMNDPIAQDLEGADSRPPCLQRKG